MDVGQPSRTALATAYARAYHQVNGEPRIFTDPLAVAISGLSPDQLGERDTATMRRNGGDPDFNRRRRLFLAARHRFAEETSALGAAAGVRQVVILGAGLDTFGYRNPYSDVRVFEVDHPDTQAWKRERLAHAGIDAPPTLTYAPVDFETQTLAAGLADAKFDADLPAVFVWLGVTMYLTPEAIDTTLSYVAARPRSSRLVLDYLYPPAAEVDPMQQARIERVAAIGEPWLTFFTADSLAARLRAHGCTEIEDLHGAALVAGYLGVQAPSADGRGGVAHVARCVVG